jgi:sensitive to high expression protein 9
MDHSNEQSVQEAATRLADVEREAEYAASKLSSSILSRYHEEQIWSDKIRRMSTWGTWGLMGVNVLLFLVFQFGFEPWRRARLVNGFEEKVLEALEREKLVQATKNDETISEMPLDGVIAAVLQKSENEVKGNAQITAIGDTTGASTTGTTISQQEEAAALDTAESHIPGVLLELRKPETWKAAAKDLFSERLISMRKQDVTLIALEGAATGAAVVTIIATLLLRDS